MRILAGDVYRNSFNSTYFILYYVKSSFPLGSGFLYVILGQIYNYPVTFSFLLFFSCFIEVQLAKFARCLKSSVIWYTSTLSGVPAT